MCPHLTQSVRAAPDSEALWDSTSSQTTQCTADHCILFFLKAPQKPSLLLVHVGSTVKNLTCTYSMCPGQPVLAA